MATFVKFNSFITAAAAGTHAGCLNADTDVLKVYATNATPDAAADSLKADLAEITAENGYPSGGSDVQNTTSQTTYVITVAGVDVTWTATGGLSFGPFRYLVLYNDTAAGKPLIGYWDRGAEVTITDPDSFTTDFGASLFTLGGD